MFFKGGFQGFTNEFSNLEEFMNAPLQSLFPSGDLYLEVQLHGQTAHQMNSSTIQEVIFSHKPNKRIIEKLNAKNIPWRVL